MFGIHVTVLPVFVASATTATSSSSSLVRSITSCSPRHCTSSSLRCHKIYYEILNTFHKIHKYLQVFIRFQQRTLKYLTDLAAAMVGLYDFFGLRQKVKAPMTFLKACFTETMTEPSTLNDPSADPGEDKTCRMVGRYDHLCKFQCNSCLLMGLDFFLK